MSSMMYRTADMIHSSPYSPYSFGSLSLPRTRHSFSAIQLGMPNSRSTAGFSAQAPNLTESGYQGVEKGAPADGKKNHHSSGNQAGPSAHGMTAAENASTTQAHVNIGNQDLGSTGAAGTPLLSTEAQMFSKEAEKIVEEERVASEKMPSYPGLSERFQLICKMGDGAFSNVYKARYHKSGQKVAIKVVRKYELNSNQVSHPFRHVILFSVLPLS